MRLIGCMGLLLAAVLLALSSLGSTRAVGAAASAALELESKIYLGEVHGRLDHLAIDLSRQRLFVAELGNDSVGVVELKRGTVRTLAELNEPQGVGYVPSTDTLYVANARDGAVRLFQGGGLMPAGQIVLGEDADNIRVDDAAHLIFVGYGNGALAVIDALSRRRIADIPLRAHPESFQLEPSGRRIFVNVPDASEIGVVDRVTGKPIATWRTDSLRANFPLALDEAHRTVLAIFRHPAKVGVFRVEDGHLVTTVSTCGDADDVFLDAKRNRIYVSCGEGYLAVLALQNERYEELARIATAPGARTSLFVPEMDRLLLAVRAAGTTPASVWVFRPDDARVK
jgi:DNA-binding beta-propeller fold protein YncE